MQGATLFLIWFWLIRTLAEESIILTFSYIFCVLISYSMMSLHQQYKYLLMIIQIVCFLFVIDKVATLWVIGVLLLLTKWAGGQLQLGQAAPLSDSNKIDVKLHSNYIICRHKNWLQIDKMRLKNSNKRLPLSKNHYQSIF